MSTEIDELEKRVARLEKRISAPMVIAGHDPTGEGSAYQPEPAPGSDAEHPPVGYVLVTDDTPIRESWLCWNHGKGPWDNVLAVSVGRIPSHRAALYPLARPIPANEGDSRLAESVAIPVGWIPAIWYAGIEETGARKIGGYWITPDPSIPWGEGYEAILPSEARPDASFFHPGTERWNSYESFGCVPWGRDSLAWRRRIPATTQTEPARDLSDKIAESVVQDLQQACHDRDELRATVDRLEAENSELRKSIDSLRGAFDERKMRVRELIEQESSLREKIARIREVAG